ncbi:MAG: tRNA (N6-isopentenyl adenosine(37)-C2)-methylthiotransferase MiaB [Deltaproteobacteria bacterium CG11_big_fil_rev_8_21_14_0_20_47_16]|nr:MAG: tRNA (N6-isopentenyl adenosine(37)-C2)-methylthiotransferase MiaB [Deltaproteobacteria bacterium CG11_big_fil_rev_8_21_14_0_20_47_16]
MQYFIKTFGCQMNEHDSVKIGAMLRQMGYQPADRPETADFILFNTCTIRDKAQMKAMSEIGKTAVLKEQHPGLVVGVCGCVAQQQKEAVASRFPHVDLLFGPDQISKLPELLEKAPQRKRAVSALDLVNTQADYEFVSLIPPKDQSGATAYVTIMKGCDNACTFCIVPSVRGAEVSRPADDILNEVKGLARHGVKEVTLLGQTVNSYGRGGRADGVSFPQLLRRIADETAIQRIRFTSPHPKDLREDLIQEYVENQKLCRHMHLPLQSGSSDVLKAMKRAYSREHYLKMVKMLQAAVPGIAITTDIIVGFPGETEADFQDTLDMIREVGFVQIYAFVYSKRPGTKAAEMPDDTSLAVKEERLQRLFDLANTVARAHNDSLIGTEQEILIEGEGERPGQWRGRTAGYTIVNVDGPAAVGQMMRVKVSKAYNYSLIGEQVSA